LIHYKESVASMSGQERGILGEISCDPKEEIVRT